MDRLLLEGVLALLPLVFDFLQGALFDADAVDFFQNVHPGLLPDPSVGGPLGELAVEDVVVRPNRVDEDIDFVRGEVALPRLPGQRPIGHFV